MMSFPFPLFLFLALASASPISNVQLQRDVQIDADLQPLWIIEAIAEGDFVKVAEIIEQQITHLIETHKNIKEITTIIIKSILVRIEKKLPTLSQAVRQKLKEILERIYAKLEAIEKRFKDKWGTENERFSLFEDIKEVINQIKNQIGGIIDTGKGIKDIIKDILG